MKAPSPHQPLRRFSVVYVLYDNITPPTASVDLSRVSQQVIATCEALQMVLAAFNFTRVVFWGFATAGCIPVLSGGEVAVEVFAHCEGMLTVGMRAFVGKSVGYRVAPVF